MKESREYRDQFVSWRQLGRHVVPGRKHLPFSAGDQPRDFVEDDARTSSFILLESYTYVRCITHHSLTAVLNLSRLFNSVLSGERAPRPREHESPPPGHLLTSTRRVLTLPFVYFP